MADRGGDAAATASSATGKRRRSVESGDEREETKMDLVQVEVATVEQQESGNVPVDEEEEKAAAPMTSIAAAEVEGGENEEGSDSEEEETLVVLELCDFKNHPLLDDYSSATLEGIDTATPMLRIGEYALHGQLEETVGTSYFYDTDTSRVPDKTYQFAGQTIKRIKFTIAPPEDV